MKGRLTEPSCVFCQRIDAGDYTPIGRDVARFEPLAPVTPGHMLFVPISHVINAAAGPSFAAAAFSAAAQYAHRKGEAFNLITSGGKEATQSVLHLHVHYVPRRHGDGLHLPWTGQT